MVVSSKARAERLRGLLDVLNTASKVALEELEKDELTSQPPTGTLPSRNLYEAERTIVGACGALSALMQRPDLYLLTVCGEFHEARALQIAVEHGIPDHLATAGKEGMHIQDLSSRTGVAAPKLERVIRTLCSIHIFDEVQEHRFANSTISTELVENPELCALLVHMEKDVFPASEKLPIVLSDPVKGPSNDIAHAAFPEYAGHQTTFWEWLEEGIPQPDGSLKPNPSLERFTTGMVGWGRTTAGPLYQEYPWDALGGATVVDVGGGEGGLCLDLSKLYPHLNFVVQDRGPVVAHADDFWRNKAPEALGRVKFMAHDFFLDNPVKGAEVYVLRYIIHDWEDARCVDILTAVRNSMTPHSRILIADHVLNTTLGHPELVSAPAPLPADYGAWSRFGHILDLDMMVLVNGIERTPAQFRELASRAGLELVKIWECRGHAQIVELRLPESS